MALAYNYPSIGLKIFVFFIPFLPIYVAINLGGNKVFSLIELLSAVILLPIFLRDLIKRKIKLNKITLFAYSFIIISPIITFANNTAVSSEGTGLLTFVHSFLLPFLLFFVINNEVKSKEDILSLSSTMFVSSLIIAVFCYFEYFTKTNVFLNMPLMDRDLTNVWGNYDIRFSSLRVKASFAQPLSLGTFISAMIAMASAYVSNKTGFKKTSLYLYILFLFPILLFSQSRGATVITIALLFLSPILFADRKMFKTSIIGLIIFGTIIVYLYSSYGSVISKNQSDLSNLYSRGDLWNIAMSSLSSVRLFGVADISQVSWLPASLKVDIVSWYLESLVFSGLVYFIFHVIFVSALAIGAYLLAKKDRFYLIITLPLLSFIFNYINVSFVGSGPYYFWIFLAISCTFIDFKKSSITENNRLPVNKAA